MKVNLRIIIGILCGVAMVSCTSTVSEPNTSQTPIQFGTSVSRAAVNSASDMTAFSVWGGYDNVKLFEGTKVNNTASGWTYEGGDRYWVPGKTFNFYAVHPVFPDGGPIASVASDGTISVTNFDCSKTGAEAIDLMTAQKNGITYTEGISPSPVDLKFSHELAKLNFVVKSENAVATITEFKVYGVDYMGTLSKKSTTATWSDKTTCQDTDTPFSINQEFVFNTTEGWEKNVFGDILLIPDNDLTDAFLKIRYKYSGETTERTSVVGLNTALTDKWEAGKNYKYSLTIEGGSLSINVTVDSWDGMDTSVSWE